MQPRLYRQTRPLFVKGRVFVDFFRQFRYNIPRKAQLSALPYPVGGPAPLFPGTSEEVGFLPPPGRGGRPMTTSEFLQFCLVIIGICGLFIQLQNKK